MTRPMRVTLFTPSLEQGGTERQLSELLTRFDRARVEASLVLCEDKVHFDDAARAVETRCIHAPVFPTPGSMRSLRDALRELRPDVVHVWRAWASIAGRFAARDAGVARVIASVRRPRMPLDEALGERFARKGADHHVTNSRGIRDELIDRARIAPEDVSVIENGVDLARFRPVTPEARAEARRALGLQGTRVLVVPARISPEKNQLGLLGALSLLRRDGALPAGLEVVFLGRDSLPLYGRRVRAEIALRGLRDLVRLVPAVQDPERWIAAADLTAVPSHFEGLSNAVVESLASGVPCLVTREANADALVRDGTDGAEARSPSPEDLAAALGALLRRDDVALHDLGAAGRAHAEARFGVAAMVRRFEDLYARVLDAPRRSG
jgi:glycosyltransferase involved in cell wall biosynthesis